MIPDDSTTWRRHDRAELGTDLGNNETGWLLGTIVHVSRLRITFLPDYASAPQFSYNPDGRHQPPEDITGRLMLPTSSWNAVRDGNLGTLVRCPTCTNGEVFTPATPQPGIILHPLVMAPARTWHLLENLEVWRHRTPCYLVGRPTGRLALYVHKTPQTQDAAPTWVQIDEYGQHDLHPLLQDNLAVIYDVPADQLPAEFIATLAVNERNYQPEAFPVRIVRPTSDPFQQPPQDDLVPLVRAALRWVYDTEQPETAIIHHEGARLPLLPTRWLTVTPQGVGGYPVLGINVRKPVKGWDTVPLNPLAPEELAELAHIVRALGHDVRGLWNGYPQASGSVQLARPPHPSLIAAGERYRAGCPEHQTVFCHHDGCPWWRDHSSQIVPATVLPADHAPLDADEPEGAQRLAGQLPVGHHAAPAE